MNAWWVAVAACIRSGSPAPSCPGRTHGLVKHSGGVTFEAASRPTIKRGALCACIRSKSIIQMRYTVLIAVLLTFVLLACHDHDTFRDPLHPSCVQAASGSACGSCKLWKQFNTRKGVIFMIIDFVGSLAFCEQLPRLVVMYRSR